MSDDNKSCPFCGRRPDTYSTMPGVAFAGCCNPECRLFLREFLPLEDWNKRPGEEALLEQLRLQEAEVARLQGHNPTQPEDRTGGMTSVTWDHIRLPGKTAIRINTNPGCHIASITEEALVAEIERLSAERSYPNAAIAGQEVPPHEDKKLRVPLTEADY